VPELLDLAERIVGWADEGEQVEAVVVHERETEVRAYEGEVESLTSAESQGVGVRVVRDGRQGFAYAGTLDPDALAEVLAEARDNLTFATPDISESAVATTTGILATGRETGCFLSSYALAEQDGETQTGFGFSLGREPADLDVEEAAADAAERSTRMLGAVKPPSGRMTVVLDPWVSAQFLGIVGGTLSGEAVQKGRSLFADRLGEDVAAPLLTLVDDPTDPAAHTATGSDGEGLATRRNVLMADGRLERFVHNSETARRAGTVSTGSAVRGYSSTPGVGVRAVAVAGGDRPPAELIAAIDDGLLVQGVTGLHSGVNAVSGDFSTGAEGLRTGGGGRAEPVREFTIASTIQKMLLDVLAIGDDVRWLPMRAAGVTLVIGELTVSGM